MMTFDQFVSFWRGRTDCDYDKYYGAQCVDLFNYYNQDVIGTGRLYTPKTGGAADLWTEFNGPGRGAYRKIENSETNYPKQGDVIIWAAKIAGVTGAAGHVGIVLTSNVNNFTSFDQNYPTGTPPHAQYHANYKGVYGWLRPIANDPKPAPAPIPVAPDPQPLPPPPPVGIPILPDPPPPAPEVEPGRGNGQQSGDVPVRTPEVATPVLEDLPEHQATFKEFPEPILVHLKYDTMAIDMTGTDAPKDVKAELPLLVSGTFMNNGRKYYRGTSGGWYGVSADDVVEEAEEPEPPEAVSSGGFWSGMFKVLRDPLGALIRLFSRLNS